MSTLDLGFRGSIARNPYLIKRLEDALDNLEGSSCTFWACMGPRAPRHMMTCGTCYAVRDINVVLGALRRQERERSGIGKILVQRKSCAKVE